MLSTWQAGDFVGAPYVLGDHRHSWSARALGRSSRCISIRPRIRRLIAFSPSFAIALIECLGFRARPIRCWRRPWRGKGRRAAVLLLGQALRERGDRPRTARFRSVALRKPTWPG